MSELLIGVAILGLIATFTITKVLTSVDEGKKRTIFKESIAALQEAHMSVAQTQGNVSDTASVYAMLNLVKVCPNDALAEGCTTQAPVVGSVESANGGGLFQSGALFTGMNPLPANQGIDVLYLDYNGDRAPNAVGDDILCLTRCANANGSSIPCSANMVQGVTGKLENSQGYCSDVSASTALYRWVYER